MDPLQSDIVFNISKFLPSAVLAETAAFNEALMDRTASGPHYRAGSGSAQKLAPVR
jgi:hypothetical protein